MTTYQKLRCRFAAVAMVATAALTYAAGPNPYIVQKVHVYQQMAASGAVVDATAPYAFQSQSPANLVLHLPNGQTLTPIARDRGDGEISYEIAEAFASKAAFDAAYPNGAYTMTGAGQTLNFTLSPDLYPTAVPQITSGGTWSSGGVLVINPSVSTTLNLSTFSTYATSGVAGHMSFSIDGQDAQIQQDVITQAAFGITVSSTPFTSVTVPAGSLTNGNIYRLNLDFDTAPTFDLTTVPGNGVIALYENHLEVWVAALTNSASAPPAPTVSTQPADQTAPVGSTVTFTAAIDQHTSNNINSWTTWYFNGAEVRGDSGVKYTYEFNGGGVGLTVHDIADADVGTYTLKFVDAGGIVVTAPATLTIGAAVAPTITTQPVSLSLHPGQSATFTVAANGPALAYQWGKDGVVIPGATTDTLTLNNVQLATAGHYGVLVSNTAGTTMSSDAVLTVLAGPTITAQPVDVSVPVGGLATFTVTATGYPEPTYQWSKDGIPLAGETNATLTLANVQATDAASYSVNLTNSEGNAGSVGALLTVTTTPAAPHFVVQPLDTTAVAGGTVTLTATANALPEATYQWFKGGDAISGATNATLQFNPVTAADAGSYTVVATNSQGVTTSAPAILSVGATSYLSNLSVRAAMVQGQTLIVGFVVQGAAKPILVRAAGPALNNYGLTGVADPHLTVFDHDGATVAGNDDWDAPLVADFSRLGAFLFNLGSKDAALKATITGPHTAQVTGTGDGTILVEGYDAGENNGPKLTNVSARYHVGTGNDILIAGFVVAGTGQKQVLVRAVGPTLASYNVPGTLADPQFTVYDQGNVVASNDNWDASLAATFSTLGAFDLIANSKDAALLVTLDAGKPYTVQVSGVNNGTGEAIVEIYDAQP